MNVKKVDVSQAHPPAQPDYFEGRVRMQELYQPERDGEESELVAVFFDTGARTIPHTHESTQVLQIVSGRCLVVIEEERRIADVGEFVIIPRAVWHWHGATRDGAAAHISIKLPGRTNWNVARRDWTAG